MREPPPVTVRDARQAAAPQGQNGAKGSTDVLGSDEKPPPRRRPAAIGAVLMACVASFVAGGTLDGSGDDEPRTTPRLAVVTSRDVDAALGDGAQPRSTVELTLVNTGARALQVLGGSVRGTGLSWTGEQLLEPGGQTTAVLIDPSPCMNAQPGLEAQGATLDVEVAEDGSRGLVVLPLQSGFLRGYDVHVRTMCGLLPVSDALSIALTGDAVDAGRDLAVPIVLRNRATQPVQLVSVSSVLDGTSAVLRTSVGASVRLPLTLPGRSLAQLRQDPTGLEPDDTSRFLAVRVDDGACADLLVRGGATVTVALRHEYADEPGRTADTFLALDLADLVDRACS
jgi:hypothetical protein